MSVFLERVYEGLELGEDPHWDASRNQLYFVDVTGRNVLCYDPATRQTAKVDLPSTVGFVIPVEGQPTKFIIGLGRDFSVLDWDGNSQQPTSITKIKTIDTSNPGNRINSGKADTEGRLWAGTTVENGEPPLSGAFYVIDLDGTVFREMCDVGNFNGLVWNADNNVMYFVDTTTDRIDAFQFNATTGHFQDRWPVFNVPASRLPGHPAGMTIDAEGMLWLCLWNGYRVIRINPTTWEVVSQINMPVADCTSCVFGGANLDELYITTGSLVQEPGAGSLYKATNIGVRGRAGGNNFKGLLPNA